jgi:hypothetical protein
VKMKLRPVKAGIVLALTLCFLAPFAEGTISTQHICKGFTGDTCWNYWWDTGHDEGRQICPEPDECFVYSGIPAGNFFCQLCTALPPKSRNQGANCVCEPDRAQVLSPCCENLATVRASLPATATLILMLRGRRPSWSSVVVFNLVVLWFALAKHLPR